MNKIYWNRFSVRVGWTYVSFVYNSYCGYNVNGVQAVVFTVDVCIKLNLTFIFFHDSYHDVYDLATSQCFFIIIIIIMITIITIIVQEKLRTFRKNVDNV